MIFAALMLVGAFGPVSAIEPTDTYVAETEEITDNPPQDTEEYFEVPAASSEPVSSQEPLPSMTPEVIETPAPSAIPEDNQDSTVIVESWSFDSDVLVYDNEKYVLNLSASLESLVTRDTVSSMLPSHVLIQDGSAVPLTWDLAQIPEEGITSDGTFVVFGTLPDGYALAEGVNAVEVQLVTVGVEELAVDDEKYLVGDAVSPGGTVINLFDYWVGDDRFAQDIGINATNETGINENHSLRFYGNSGIDGDYINTWNNVYGEGNGGIKPGIVNKTLDENGFPKLNKDYVKTNESSPGGSLKYLFDNSDYQSGQPGKVAFMDVKGLLQAGTTEDGDYNGYYFYDAEKNFASLDEDSRTFQVFDTWGVKSTSLLAYNNNGQFFPFNQGSNVFTEGNGSLVQKDIYGTSGALYHLFGMTMSSRFIQDSGGTNKGNDVIYEFSGDDDVWIFIDGVLVGDLGGIHNQADISINFKTGEVQTTSRTGGQKITETNTLYKLFESAGEETSVQWNEDNTTFKDDTYHTLNFFYLERGGGASNMKLKYNLVTVPESSIVKVDQTGEKISGAEFELKFTAENYNETIASGTTDSNGNLVFVNKTTNFPISLDEIRTRQADLRKVYKDIRIVLSETKTPVGYRGTEDIQLYFKKDVEEDILLVNNKWKTGAYAMPQVTTTLNSTVTYYDPNDHKDVGTLSLTGSGNEYDGNLFAVVLKKKKNVWCPISGTYEDGYKVANDGSMQSIIVAAKENWFPFQLTNSTDYQVNLTELPGDINSYYQFALDEAEYAVGYYYSTANTVNGISAENTYPIYYPGLGDDNIAARVFSTRIYVPNIKNRIIIQKLDDSSSDKYVAGAKFDLYSSDSVEEIKNEDGKVTGYQLKAYQTPYDSLTTNISMKQSHDVELIGANSFPTAGKVLPYGTYFIQEQKLSKQENYTVVSKGEKDEIIKETVPYDGYIVNTELIKVVVDKTGIYAYAGDAGENDGVTVQYGVGAIVRSMLRFAEEDEIDMTLHDINAKLYVSSEPETIADPGNGEYVEVSEAGILDLAYNASSALYEYGPVKPGGKTAFTIDSGWAKVKIYQCSYHKPDNGSHWENLSEDLSAMFSRSVIVRVKNQSAGELKLTKNVVTNSRQILDNKQPFAFNLQLDASGLNVAFDAALSETLTAKVLDSSGNETERTITLEKKDGNTYTSDSGTVSLTNGESLLIEQLPAGIKYSLSEVENTAFITDVSSQVVTMLGGTKQEIAASADPPDNPANGIKPQSGSIQRFMRTEVKYINTLTEFAFLKVDESGQNPLSDAKFALYELKTDKADDYKNTVLKTDSDGNLTDNNQEADWKLVKTVISNKDGVISFSGINYRAKEFRLVELTAPPGYTVPIGQWRIVYDEETKSFIPVKDASGVKNPPAIEVINSQREDGIQYQIRNYKPQDLPSSGNTGISWFIKTGGTLMICSALVIFFLMRKKQKDDSKRNIQE